MTGSEFLDYYESEILRRGFVIDKGQKNIIGYLDQTIDHWSKWQKHHDDIFPIFKKKLPFSIAHAKVVKLESTSDLIFWKESLMLFHNALNTTAKRTVFVGSLDEFFLVNIKYKKLSKEIRYFLNCSRKLFYENEVLPNTDEKTLFVKLIHKMALIEKRLD